MGLTKTQLAHKLRIDVAGVSVLERRGFVRADADGFYSSDIVKRFTNNNSLLGELSKIRKGSPQTDEQQIINLKELESIMRDKTRAVRRAELEISAQHFRKQIQQLDSQLDALNKQKESIEEPQPVNEGDEKTSC